MKTLSFLFACLLTVVVLKAQTALEEPWFPDNRVKQITRGDGKIFMSGDFTWFGPSYNSSIAIFNNELAHDSSYPVDDKYGVRNSVSDGNGGWYVSTYGTIMHIKSDKTIEDLPFLFEGGGYPINTIDKAGDILYVGGNFSSVNGAAKRYAAAIDLTTNTLTSWNPDPGGYVYDIKAMGSVVYVGGSFSAIGGQTRSKIAAIDAVTGLATSWNANVTTGSGYIFTIEADASNVYFGGSFSNVASSVPSRRNFAAVNTTTGAVTTLNPRPDDDVTVLLLDGATLYMAGDFTQVAGINKPILAAIDVTTGSLTAFSTTLNSDLYSNNYVYAFAVDGQKLFIAGDFLTINGVERARLAVVDKTTGELEPMEDRAIGGYVLTVSVSGGKVLTAGGYSGISGITNSLGCIALDETTGQATDWIPEIPRPPAEHYIGTTYLHYQGNRVYYWQDLYGDGRGATLGALNSNDGSAIAAWSVTVEGEVFAWAFSTDALYLAGDFTEINGNSRNGFAAVDMVTGALLPWTTSYTPSYPDEYINSMVVYNNTLYAGGKFSFTDDGIERNNLAAWNATTGDLNSWAPQVTLEEFQDAKIGTAHNAQVYLIGSAMLRVNAVSGEIDEDWQPLAGYVESIVIQGSSVYMAGSFSPGLVRADISTGEISGWQPELNDVYDSEGSVDILAISGTKLFAGGRFSYETGSHSRSGFAVYLLPVPTNNQPPQIEAITTAVPIEGIVTINLVPLISDVDDNQDLSTLQLLNELSERGASASISDSHVLTLDYGGVEFFGTDYVNIEVCDFLAECTQQELTVEVGGDVSVYNALSPNGDGENETFIIQYVDILPETQSNKVTIYNRWGDVVFDVSDYNNADRVFIGQDNNGKNLPAGTYFYKIEFRSRKPVKTGFLSLRR